MSNLLGDKHLLFIMAEEQKEMQVELAQEETKKVAPVATTSAEADEKRNKKTGKTPRFNLLL